MPIGLPSPCSLPVVSTVCGAAGGVASSAANSVFSSLAQTLASAQAELLKVLFTAWLGIPTPGLTGAGSPVVFLQSHLSGLVGAAAVCGMIVAGIRMMFEYKHEHTVEAFKALIRTIIIIGAGSAAIAMLSAAGDAFSTWIVGQAAGSASVAQTFTTDANLQLASTVSPGVILLLAPLSMLGILIQIALLLVRSTFLVILAGCWPLAAAASTTEDGRAWYRRLTGWIIAFLLFKPVAGIIYATAIRMLTGGPSNELDVIEGVILLTMACLALPALLRLVAPMTGRLGGIGTAEVLGAAVGVAAGAAMVVGTGGAGAAAAPAAAGGGSLAGGAGAAAGGGGGGLAGLAGGASGGGPGGGPAGGSGGSGGSGGGSGGGADPSGTSGVAAEGGGGLGGKLAGGSGDSSGTPAPSSSPADLGGGDASGAGQGQLPGLSPHGLSSLAGAPKRMGDEAIGGDEPLPESGAPVSTVGTGR